MKTKILLFATLLITTITFSQTSKKGYDYYNAVSDSRMNKGELVHVIAKDANKSRKGAARKNRRPQLFSVQKSSKFNVKQEFGPTKAQQRRQRPIDGKQEARQNNRTHLRKRTGRTKYNNSTNNKAGKSNELNIRKKPGRTKATDYNSSRSNKNSNH